MLGRIVSVSAIFAGAAFALACSGSNTATPGSSGSSGTSGSPSTSGSAAGGGASADQIDSCKMSCDKMKFFGCNSAEEQAACYDECGKATPDQIQLFDACAGTSICDPACRTNITPKPPAGMMATGGGATTSSCGTACDKLVSCSFVKVGDKANCEAACQTNAYQYQIDCINNTTCDKIESACGGTSGGSSSGSSGASSGGSSGSSGTPDDTVSISQCQTACDQILFFSCFDATAQSTCRSSCTTSTSAKRDTFSACVTASAGQCTNANACYTSFQN
jgi:hypothetical protein